MNKSKKIPLVEFTNKISYSQLAVDSDIKDSYNRFVGSSGNKPMLDCLILGIFLGFGYSNPSSIKIKNVGSAAFDMTAPYIQGWVKLKDKNGNFCGYSMESHESKKTTWIHGVWKDADGQIYAEVKLTFFKTEAYLSLKYVDPFTFRDIFECMGIPVYSDIRSVTINDGLIQYKQKEHDFIDPYQSLVPLIASNLTILAVQREYGNQGIKYNEGNGKFLIQHKAQPIRLFSFPILEPK